MAEPLASNRSTGPRAWPNQGGLNELLLDGVTDKRGVVRQLQFLENARPVGTDGAGAQEHFRRDLVDLLARGEDPQHPLLEVAKSLVQGFFTARGRTGCQFLPKVRAHKLSSCG